jgi:hypothetical protein
MIVRVLVTSFRLRAVTRSTLMPGEPSSHIPKPLHSGALDRQCALIGPHHDHSGRVVAGNDDGDKIPF